jgi:ATP-dependent helicase/nuclease subunit B
MFPAVSPKAAAPIREYTPLDTALHAGPDGHGGNRLSADSVDRLFGPVVYTSASRLEAYARCPFAYYMTYLLKAKPRKQYEVLPTDLGSLFHDVVALYAKRAGWQPRGKHEIGEVVAELVAELTPEGAAFHGSARNRHILEKARRVCTASLWALTEHIKQGRFKPLWAEYDLPPVTPVPLGNGRSLSLTGCIDRADLFAGPDGDTYIKIIDYKSGAARFDPEEVRRGTQLQLMLYMNALLQSPELQHLNPRPGGVFYFPIGDPLLKTDTLPDEAEREIGLLKAFKMSGIALAEAEAVTGMDIKLEAGGESHILPVRVNKGGDLGKSAALLDSDGFARLGREADEKMKELTLRLTAGDIAPAPCAYGTKSPCEYCGFGAVCKHND